MAGIGCNHGGVLSLESLASNVFLRKVLYKATPETAEAVREIVDQILIGKVKKSARESWADSFYQSHKDEMELYYSMKWIPSVFVALDCILDEHFQGLTVCLPLPVHKSFAALISMITRRCPKLQVLQVEFRDKLGFRKDRHAMPEPIAPGSCLSFLKSLTLDFTPILSTPPAKDWRKSIYSIIGKHCTVLTKLKICGDAAGQMDIMPLVVNRDVADILFSRDECRWNQNHLLSDFLIPSEFLNPLCFTLKDFSLVSSYGWPSREIHLSTCAFALRYLTKLEVVDFGVWSINVVEHLYKTFRHSQNEEFEKACIKAASRIGLSMTSPLTFVENPVLFLKELDHVPLNNVDSLLAVGALCPHLEKVDFTHDRPLNSISPATFRTIFESWSKKIQTLHISFSGDHPDALQIVVQTFGSNLRQLHLFGESSSISLDNLATVCTKLEILVLKSCSFSDSETDASRWTPDTFFPLLTHFDSAFYSCLGAWAPLIERKSSLVSLSLGCCHIGTNAHRSRLEWSQISKFWASNLQNLEVGFCTGLTLTMVAELIPRLSSLRRIVLPYSVASQDPELAYKMVQDLANREEHPKIRLYWEKRHSFRHCPFQLT